MNAEKMSTQVAYIAIGKNPKSISERVKKILSLRDSYEKMVLVATGDMPDDAENIFVKSIPNPTGLLRIIGLGKIKKKIDKYLFFPSAGILYVHRMKKKIEQSIKHDLDQGKKICLITSVPSHDTCLVGLYIKKKYPDIYWIVDWRDLWSFDENYFKRTPGIYRARLLKLEKEILNSCDMNVTTNSYAKEVLINHYHVPRQRVVSINQSFSRNDFIGDSFSNNNSFLDDKGREIKIGFLGTLFKPPRVPGKKVLEAMRRVRNSGINVKLHHYGIIPVSVKRSHDREPNGDVIFYGSVQYKESLKRISQCDFLLLVLADLPNCKAVMNIKLPDYLLVNRPIIAIVPEPSAISDAIKKTNSGFVIPANQDWGAGLERLMREITEGADIPKRNEEEIDLYDWRNVSRQWIDLINNYKSKAGAIR